MSQLINKLTKFDKKHTKHCGSALEEKLYVHSNIRLLKPRKVLEIGVSAGHMTCWIAAALEDNDHNLPQGEREPHGMCTSVDNWSGNHGGKAHSSTKAEQRLFENGLGHRVHFVGSDSQEFLKAQPDDCFDIVWVDGDHSFEMAEADTEEAIRVAKQLVMVHDARNIGAVREACKAIGGGAHVRGRRGIWVFDPRLMKAQADV